MSGKKKSQKKVNRGGRATEKTYQRRKSLRGGHRDINLSDGRVPSTRVEKSTFWDRGRGTSKTLPPQKEKDPKKILDEEEGEVCVPRAKKIKKGETETIFKKGGGGKLLGESAHGKRKEVIQKKKRRGEDQPTEKIVVRIGGRVGFLQI